MKARLPLLIAFLFAAASVTACGSAVTNDTCDPGSTRSCTCPGGGSGTQTCAADGLGWLTCDCGAADADADADGADDGGADDGGPDALPPLPRELLDLLLVIDNSPGMDQEQVYLMAAMPAFLGMLFEQAAAAGLDLNLNVGVVSTDMGTYGFPLATCTVPSGGDDGCLLHEPRPPTGCDATYPPFLSRLASTAGSYTEEELARDVACIGTLGTTGCGFEQPFRAATAAVTVNVGPAGCNAGFLRADSAVVVLFLSNENDCSVPAENAELLNPSNPDLAHVGIRCKEHADQLVPVPDVLEELQSLVDAGHALFVGAIVGVPPGEPACNGFGTALEGCLRRSEMEEQVDPATTTRLLPVCEFDGGDAVPGRRFVELAERLGERAYVTSICRTDHIPALAEMAAALF